MKSKLGTLRWDSQGACKIYIPAAVALDSTFPWKKRKDNYKVNVVINSDNTLKIERVKENKV